MYERCKKLLDSIKKDVSKPVDTLQHEGAFTPTAESPRPTYSVRDKQLLLLQHLQLLW